METGEIIYEKVYASPRLPPKIPWEMIGWRNWVQKLLDKQKAPNQPNQTLIQFIEKSDLLWQNERPVRVLKKSIHVSLLTARIPIFCWTFRERQRHRQRRRCRLDLERGDPLVDTGSPHLEEVGVDFRVSGLPHAVVKQAENSRVRELVKKIESHPHRQDLQADLQQSNAYNPFSEKSKKMIRDTGNVELFELCETIPKVQSKKMIRDTGNVELFELCETIPKMQCFTGSKASFTALVGISWERINPADVFTDGNWIFSQSRTMLLRRCDLMAIVMGRLKNKETLYCP